MLINSESPWKITQRGGDWPYSYKMSVQAWRTLLAQAKLGNPEAEWEVADRYADGCRDRRGTVIVKRSPKKAAKWFRRAAEHGYAPAQNELGVLLAGGYGVKKDVYEALSWLKKSFRAEDGCAVQNIAITYREIGNFQAAVKWFRKSADYGDGEAIIQLGIHYYWGKGITKNQKAAVEYFRKASKAKNISEAGRDDAFFWLGIAYYEGNGVRFSIPTARAMFKRANLDNDHPPARDFLRQLHA
jgi:uncharacterized protein